ncbi:hypothetical protein TNCV_189141 [Trichonephila clavipes]|nr:hypothetical protein TNCV_189141 [Trichonephila clavipes]
MKANLIASRYECPKCREDTSLKERKGTVNGYEWRCRSQSKDNPHDGFRSAQTHLRLPIRAWCRPGPNVQKRLIYVKYVEPQTFYQLCCADSNSGGVLVTIPCVKVMDGAVSTAALCNCKPGKTGE